MTLRRRAIDVMARQAVSRLRDDFVRSGNCERRALERQRPRNHFRCDAGRLEDVLAGAAYVDRPLAGVGDALGAPRDCNPFGRNNFV